MRDVFAKAEAVVMWVDEEDKFISYQLALIKKWANYRVRFPGSSQPVEHEYNAPLQATEDTKDEGDT